MPLDIAEFPPLPSIGELRLEDSQQSRAELRAAHRRDRLDALVEIALHEVRAADEQLRVAAFSK